MKRSAAPMAMVAAPALILFSAIASAQQPGKADKPEAPAAAEESRKSEEKSPPGDGRTASGPVRLTIGSWGGGYSRSQEIAFVKPFTAATGIEATLVTHENVLDKLKSEGDSPSPAWDVLDLDADTLEKACRGGLLEKFTPGDIRTAGESVASVDDFLEGGIHDCGIAAVAWSSLIVYDRRAFKKKPPESPADFFDLEKFPGKRALPREPAYLLPLALMADGVAADDVYTHLESPTGIDHALAMLDRLGGEIVWWQRGREPVKFLAEGKAALALAFNGRVFHSIVREGKPIGIVWTGQVYNLDMWAVPKGTPNRKAAFRFIAFSIQPERLAEQTRWLPYGPMRKSAIAKIGSHAVAKVDMAPYIPTTERNLSEALRNDAAWWQENASRIKPRFEAWLAAYDKRQSQRRAQESEDGKADEND